jgi:hypothetical protein
VEIVRTSYREIKSPEMTDPGMGSPGYDRVV